MFLAASLVQANPGAAPLDKIIIDPHLDDGIMTAPTLAHPSTSDVPPALAMPDSDGRYASGVD